MNKARFNFTMLWLFHERNRFETSCHDCDPE